MANQQSAAARQQDLWVRLANRGNPDHGQDPNQPLPGTKPDAFARVASLQHASAACRHYIHALDLGAGNWAGGAITDAAGTDVGRVAYNGRVFASDGSLLEEASPKSLPPLEVRPAGEWALGTLSRNFRRSILHVATCHVPRHTAEALGLERADCGKASLWSVLPYEPWGASGWIIWCGGCASQNDNESAVDPDVHPELYKLMRFADRLGFDYVQLDEAGRTLPPELEFKEFTW